MTDAKTMTVWESLTPMEQRVFATMARYAQSMCHGKNGESGWREISKHPLMGGVDFSFVPENAWWDVVRQEADLIRVLDAVTALNYVQTPITNLRNNFAPVSDGVSERLRKFSFDAAILAQDICMERLSSHNWPTRSVQEIKAHTASSGIPPEDLDDMVRFAAAVEKAHPKKP